MVDDCAYFVYRSAPVSFSFHQYSIVMRVMHELSLCLLCIAWAAVSYSSADELGHTFLSFHFPFHSGFLSQSMKIAVGLGRADDSILNVYLIENPAHA